MAAHFVDLRFRDLVEQWERDAAFGTGFGKGEAAVGFAAIASAIGRLQVNRREIASAFDARARHFGHNSVAVLTRSEERRVGKAGWCKWRPPGSHKQPRRSAISSC